MVLSRSNFSRFTLPDVNNPPDKVCFQIEVPNDRFHLAAFFGVMRDLTVWTSWYQDGTHAAADAAGVWRDIYFKLQPGCGGPTPPVISSGEVDLEMLIRQNPTNPCLIETSANGTDWCLLFDISLCTNFGTQPGPGSPQPPPGGGDANYCATLQANGLLLLPTLVNTGDTIHMTASGAGWDGSEFDFGPLWRCPDGSQFIAGACTSFTTTDSGDPVPTANHMALIYLIGSSYYLATEDFTIPSGVVNQQVQVQVNDISLTNNQGSYQVCAKVTNNSIGTFTHTFDFTATPAGWVPHSDPSLTAVWSSGNGWIPLSTGNPHSANIDLPAFSSRVFTGFTLQYLDVGGGNSSSGAVVKVSFGGTTWHSLSPLVGSPSPQTVVFSGSLTATTLFIEIEDADATTIVIQKITVQGAGSDPF